MAEPLVPMIYTARFGNRRLRSGEFQAVPICLWLPKYKPPYPLQPTIRPLAPKANYLRAPRPIYNDRYLGQLQALGAEKIGELLAKASQDERPMALLCYEDLRKPDMWCHRRLFADWYLGQTGQDIPELAEMQDAMF